MLADAWRATVDAEQRISRNIAFDVFRKRLVRPKADFRRVPNCSKRDGRHSSIDVYSVYVMTCENLMQRSNVIFVIRFGPRQHRQNGRRECGLRLQTFPQDARYRIRAFSCTNDTALFRASVRSGADRANDVCVRLRCCCRYRRVVHAPAQRCPRAVLLIASSLECFGWSPENL